MKISEMILRLQALEAENGNIEVLVTDGFQARCYRGEYIIEPFVSEIGERFIDIGIGGCEEE
jgi:hypothetical protein